ncbi:SusC/RagA family TonB-linked outer membrane protein [Adhaeribacter swui]|uniref:SusC/RagA family TonB-linked outer membrane protein n=1 Tax=Adhaeribacter swui TaxID=2086471 RepID=A0A7G7GBH6_9BACT|nr:SusC/RagA family TonB-linked outer membrane protein [Adhaeribacter swui]QNF34510.1 SusC/RagA family TonB-linked outer membrane protein [Adhaeribacter swui]
MKKKYSLMLFGALLLCCQVSWAQLVVKGLITDEAKQPMPGVTVLLKGTSTGTATNAEGTYSLQVPNGNGTLVFSFIGYVTKEVAINNQTVINTSLASDAQALNEVVVTALGIKREQKALGYSVSTVSAEQITQAGNTNFASALYGKAAGVKITTAPGGATSAANVQIRGINSLSGNTQPLYVVDGIVIRNTSETGATNFNNGGYYSDTKIRGNGVLDINPADIESLSVLKGASASALYGSEASNGVIVITTKRGAKNKGLGVDLNYVFNTEEIAFGPKYQNVYGPGYDRETNLQNGATEEGWIPVDLDGDGVNESQRPYFRAYGQFGPKMEGQLVPWWDGSMKTYSARRDNYKDFYRRGYNSSINLALSNQTDKSAYRFSFTRLDNEGIQRGGKLERNTFNLNSNLKLNDKINTDIIVNYVNSKVHNRPEQINRVTANYGGFFSRADDMQTYLDKFQTSAGYKYVPYDQPQRNPSEALKYNIRATDLMDFLWRQIKNNEDEYQNRLISSVTLNYEITKNLRFRGRVGNDFTSINIENEQFNEYPLAFNGTNSTGYYGLNSGRYSILYTDELLTYSNKFSDDFDFSVSGGFQGRQETHRYQSSGTNGGLLVENWFNLNNSQGFVTTSAWRKELVKYAFLGIANFGFREYLFLEATARKEYSSTLAPKNNSYFYPSVNGSFVFSQAFNMPKFLSFGKLRAGYGVVANAPEIYAANIAYNQNTIQFNGSGVPVLSSMTSYGNNEIRPEEKRELEFGLETRILNNKLGVDLTYYNSRMIDQILRMQLPTSTGANDVLANLGELRSYGYELALNATPIEKNIKWDTRFNFALNRTKVQKLMPGLDRLTYYDADGGAIKMYAEVGQPLGDIYVHPRETDANGNFIIDGDGYYTLSTDYVKVGNTLPKIVGGLANTVSFKNLSLNFLVDYRLGGKLVSTPLLYGKGSGLYEETLQHRDAEHGGIPYYINEGGDKVRLPDHNATAPNNAKVYHDGVLLEGVTTDGTPNQTIVDAANYYLNTYGWSTGWYENGAVFKNSYVKMRELTLSYNLPQALASKLRFQNMSVSLIGRNLFYFWKTVPHLDPETGIGTSWNRQGVDEGSMAPTRSYGVSLHVSF